MMNECIVSRVTVGCLIKFSSLEAHAIATDTVLSMYPMGLIGSRRVQLVLFRLNEYCLETRVMYKDTPKKPIL